MAGNTVPAWICSMENTLQVLRLVNCRLMIRVDAPPPNSVPRVSRYREANTQFFIEKAGAYTLRWGEFYGSIKKDMHKLREFSSRLLLKSDVESENDSEEEPYGYMDPYLGYVWWRHNTRDDSRCSVIYPDRYSTESTLHVEAKLDLDAYVGLQTMIKERNRGVEKSVGCNNA